MKKADLVEALNHFVAHKLGTMKGQQMLARYFALYFKNLEIPTERPDNFWRIEPYIPHLLIGACETFRTTDDPAYRQIREAYEAEVGQPFPSVTDVWGDGVNQALTVESIGNIFRDIFADDTVDREIFEILNAERTIMLQAIYKFCDRVLNKGLHQLIVSSEVRGIRGTFGSTILRVYPMAGRLMVTFARTDILPEEAVTFVGSVDDPLGLTMSPYLVHTDVATAIAMISDVINFWPEDYSAQAQHVLVVRNITLG